MKDRTKLLVAILCNIGVYIISEIKKANDAEEVAKEKEKDDPDYA